MVLNKKNIFELLLFVLLLLLIYLGKMSGLILPFVLMYLLVVEKRVGYAHLNKLFLLLLPIFISLFVGLFIYPLYDVFKDLYYFFYFIFMFTFGYLFYRHLSVNNILNIVIYLSVILSVYHVVYMLFVFGFDCLIDPRYLREHDSRFLSGFVSTPFVLALLLSSRYFYKISLITNSNTSKLCIFILLISMYLTGSRTDFVTFLLMFSILLYPFYKRNLSFFFKYLILSIIAITLIVLVMPNSGFVDVLKRSFIELSFSDFKDLSEINSQYRGFEMYRGLVTYFNQNAFGLLFGGGFGKMVDLGFSFFLAGEYRRYIPYLHNGYMFILVKTGLLGLIVYGIVIFKLIKQGFKSASSDISFQTLIILILPASTISLCLINYVIAAFFNPVSAILIFLMGVSYSYQVDNQNLQNE